MKRYHAGITRPPGPHGYSIKETCELVGIGKTLMYRLIKEGEIQPVKIGRRTIVPSSQIAKLFQDHGYLEN